MQRSPSHRSPAGTGLFDPLDGALRRSEAGGMLARGLCCVLALMTPYAMFLLNGALHP